MATGCLSAKPPEIDGVKDRAKLFTGRWSRGVSSRAKIFAVIGTVIGIQSIPLLAEQAAQLTVFQRTPNFALPAHNGAAPADRRGLLEGDRAGYREQARGSLAGVPYPQQTAVSWQLSDAERRERFEQAGHRRSRLHTTLWADQESTSAATRCPDLIREKIRPISRTRRRLKPDRDHPFGAKRPCLGHLYAAFNRPNVTLGVLQQEPIAITAWHHDRQAHVGVDVIVFATGFIMTSASRGASVRPRWRSVRRRANGPQTYLGLTVAGFPNFFMVTGPGSPSVLSNMAVSIEQHADWVADRLIAMRDAGFTTVEATETAQAGWARHMADCATLTLHRLANTWYTAPTFPARRGA
jgi:cation diffusion facilitator CzcD-associated flavoprotein CzcO